MREAACGTPGFGVNVGDTFDLLARDRQCSEQGMFTIFMYRSVDNRVHEFLILATKIELDDVQPKRRSPLRSLLGV